MSTTEKEKKAPKVNQKDIENEQTLKIIQLLSEKAIKANIRTETYLNKLIPEFKTKYKLDLAFLVAQNGGYIINAIVKFKLTDKFIDLVNSYKVAK